MSLYTDTAELAIVLRAKDEASAVMDKAAGSASGLGAMAAKGLAIAGGAALAFAGSSVLMASRFEDAMRQVETQGGISAKAMEALKQPVLDLSAQVGTSATDLAKSLMPIAAEGYKSADAMNVLKAAAIGSKVGNADLMTTTTALTTAMKDYNFTGGQATQVMDQLLTAVASGRTNFQDLGGSLATVLPIASAFHISFQGVLGAVTQMTSQGIPAAQATQELRMSISALSAPTTKQTKEMEALGLSSTNLAKMMTSGPDGLVTAMQVITEHVGKKFPAASQGYDEALKAVFGNVKALQSALVLTGPHFKATIDATNGLAHASDGAGYTMQKWKEMQGDFSVQLGKVRATIEDVMISVGERLLPVVTAFLSWATNTGIPAIEKVAGAFVKWVGSLHGLWSAVGSVFADIKAAVADVVQWISSHWAQISQDTSTAFTVVMNIVGAVGGFLVSVLSPAVRFLASNFQYLMPILVGVIGAFVAWKVAMGVQALMNTVSVAIFMFQAGLQGATVAEVGASTGAYAFGTALKFIMANPIVLFIAGIIAVGVLLITHWNQVVAIAKTVWGAISKTFEAAWHDVAGFIGGLVHDVQSGFNTIASIVSTIFGAIGTVVSTAIKWYFTPLTTAIGWIGDAFNVIGTIAGKVFGAIGNAINAVLGPIKTVVGAIGSVVGAIGSFFGGGKTPGHDAGGKFSVPHLAMIAESGTEWVINQRQAGPFAPMLDALVGAGSLSNAPSGGGGSGAPLPATGGHTTIIPITLTLDGRVVSQIVTQHQGKQLRLQAMGAGAR